MSSRTPHTRTVAGMMSVRISALLLTVQALTLIGLSSWVWLGATPQMDDGDVLPTTAVLDILLSAVVFFPLGLLGLLGALALASRWRRAWIPAMLLQAAILGVCLYFYFALPSATVSVTGVIYVIMASCIVVVLYLNTADVRLAFHAAPSPPHLPVSSTQTTDEFTA